MRTLHHQANTIMIRGIISLLFGGIALFAPAIGLEIIVLLFGAYAFADGITAFVVGLRSSVLLMIEGLVGIIAGLYILFMTNEAVIIFISILGAWAIGTGILEIIAAVELRKHIKNEVWMFFVGCASIVFGIYVFVYPLASAQVITFVFGIYAIMFGVFLLILGQTIKSIRFKKAKK